MKAAREMHRSGLVREAVYRDGWLEGVVMMGGQPKRVRMKIISATHMERSTEKCIQNPTDVLSGSICTMHILFAGLT